MNPRPMNDKEEAELSYDYDLMNVFDGKFSNIPQKNYNRLDSWIRRQTDWQKYGPPHHCYSVTIKREIHHTNL